MPRTRKIAGKKRSGASSRTRKFVCPDCGFKAAHAMGLGRHRTAIHGVPSKRELAAKSSRRGDAARVTRLERRIADLERRYDLLLKGLRKTASGTNTR